MEEWEFEFKWLEVRHKVKQRMGKTSLPYLNVILLLIGIQEYGRLKTKFSREEKQDLLHIASCRLLSQDGFYKFTGLDEEGWPHYEMLKPFKLKGVKEQEIYLKHLIIDYFERELNN